MVRMKKFAVTALLFLMTFTAASATTKEESSAQSGCRTGYRGSISAHAMFNVWLGAETSHGYIFNRRHYVGGGIGASVAPVENIYVLGHIFAEYRYFILTQDSSPTLGAKAGLCTDLRNDPSGPPISRAAEIEINIGWDWTFKNGSGVFLQFAAPFFISDFFQFLPKLSFGVEF